MKGKCIIITWDFMMSRWLQLFASHPLISWSRGEDTGFAWSGHDKENSLEGLAYILTNILGLPYDELRTLLYFFCNSSVHLKESGILLYYCWNMNASMLQDLISFHYRIQEMNGALHTLNSSSIPCRDWWTNYLEYWICKEEFQPSIASFFIPQPDSVYNIVLMCNYSFSLA